jgi:hypothetical protein
MNNIKIITVVSCGAHFVILLVVVTNQGTK